MTSEATDQPTKEYFGKHAWFGLPREAHQQSAQVRQLGRSWCLAAKFEGLPLGDPFLRDPHLRGVQIRQECLDPLPTQGRKGPPE